MVSEKTEMITLAIESAIKGGSVAILDDKVTLAALAADSAASRAEDLLTSIANVLNSASVEMGAIGSIVVSAGPGSFTGIRIGMATAMGLSMAIGCRLCSVSVMDSIYARFGAGESAMVVVPMGKNDACWQLFEAGITGNPAADDADKIPDIAAEHLSKGQKILIYPTLAASFAAELVGYEIVDTGRDLASTIAMYAMTAAEKESGPIYVKHSRYQAAVPSKT